MLSAEREVLKGRELSVGNRFFITERASGTGTLVKRETTSKETITSSLFQLQEVK